VAAHARVAAHAWTAAPGRVAVDDRANRAHRDAQAT
jgi:hypothetical protein